MSLTTIAICVPTFKRPNGLKLLLESLVKLNINGIQPHLIVVDNDSDASGRSVVETFQQSAPFPVLYVVEPARGLSTVRNRLVAEANALGTEYLAFADDDQTLDREWLSLLLQEANRSGSDVVRCKVTHRFPEGTPQHIKVCFREWDVPTGTRANGANTGGTLFRLDAFNAIPGPFDLRANFTGGEDSLLSVELASQGKLITWCIEAIAYEHVPKSRCNPNYIIKRAYRVGTTRGKLARWVNPTPVRIAKSATVSCGLIVVSFAQLVFYLVADRSQWLNRLRKIGNGFGGLLALASTGASPSEYAQTHGE